MRTYLIGSAIAMALVACKKDESKGTEETANRAPVANAGSDISQTADGIVHLDGGGSYDPDGDSIAFNWAFDSAPAASALLAATDAFAGNGSTSPSSSFTPDAPGTYVVRLVVTDGYGLSSSPDHVVVNIEEGQVPVANAGPDQTGTEGDTFTLDGSASYDSLGRDLSYAWSFTSVPSASSLTALTGATAAQASFVADAGGVYIVSLVVDNGLSSSNPDTAVIKVSSASPTPPVAIAGDDITSYDCTDIALDGTDSYDPNGEDLEFLWSLQTMPETSSCTNACFADRAGSTTTFQADVAGEYLLTLAVFDGTSWSAPDLLTVTTEERAYNTAPSVDAGSPKTTDAGEAACELNGYTYDCDDCSAVTVTLGDDAAVNDADGDKLTYLWEAVSGDAEFADASSLVTTVTLSGAAPVEPSQTETTEYELKLTVTDCTGEAKNDSVIYMVTCTGAASSRVKAK